MRRLIIVGALLLSGCASHKQLRCRFTAINAKHAPIKPHDKWKRGMPACIALIGTLAGLDDPIGIGVEVRGTLKQRKALQETIKILSRPEWQNEVRREQEVAQR